MMQEQFRSTNEFILTLVGMSYILQMDKLGQTLNNCKQHAAKIGIRAEICKSKLFKNYLIFQVFFISQV